MDTRRIDDARARGMLTADEAEELRLDHLYDAAPASPVNTFLVAVSQSTRAKAGKDARVFAVASEQMQNNTGPTPRGMYASLAAAEAIAKAASTEEPLTAAYVYDPETLRIEAQYLAGEAAEVCEDDAVTHDCNAGPRARS